MRIGWLGFHEEGIPALRALLEAGEDLVAVISLDDESAAKRSGAADYLALCEEHGVELHRIKNINDAESIRLLSVLQLDLLLVIGWSQIVHECAMQQVRLGLVGAHASELPHNRGSAPVNWAIIRGEKWGGNTLIWLSEDVDAGDIISSRRFPITRFDTCKSVYDKVAASNAEMIVQFVKDIRKGNRPGTRQPPSDEPILPRRRPEDGEIEWDLTASEVYDFVRALTRPYPGAFCYFGGRRYVVWNAALTEILRPPERQPGESLGSITSPVETACGMAVACCDAVIILLELEDDAGKLYSGRDLVEFAQSVGGGTNARA